MRLLELNIASRRQACYFIVQSSLIEKAGHETKCSGYVRKNTGSFGWDCAPAYVTAGIWKSVWLRVFDGASCNPGVL